MEQQPASGREPSLLLIGMRGAGKTTLGQIAAEHLHVSFIDADDLFTQRHSAPSAYVATNGWPAFRRAETQLLRELLADCSRDGGGKVISLGGGVVEEAENRELLQRAWQADDGLLLDTAKGIAVLHVFREIGEVLREPETRHGRPAPKWLNAASSEVWNRRRPWFRECSSHEFVNLSNPAEDAAESSRAARQRFEAVERDFMIFLHRMLPAYSATTGTDLMSLLRQQRSYLVTLPFPDLTPHIDILPVLATGASAVELRADLLFDPDPPQTSSSSEAYENPSLSFISQQIAMLRRHLPDVPIVFTLRTPAQGGRYPSQAGEAALFASLRHALKLGADCIDLEQGLDVSMSQSLITDAKRRATLVIVSWRDVRAPGNGGFSWSGGHEALEHYNGALRLGGAGIVVKVVGTAESVSDNFALRLFAARMEEQPGTAPLCAYNMGAQGRISRFLNPLLASVTHPLVKQITKRGVVGSPSMTFQQVQQALHLSGLLDERKYYVLADSEEQGESVASKYNAWFAQMGLPYAMAALPSGFKLRTSLESLRQEPFFAGVCLVGGSAIAAGCSAEECDAESLASGQTDTLIQTKAEKLRGEHVEIRALATLIRRRIAPSNELSPLNRAILVVSSRESTSSDSAAYALKAAGVRKFSVLTRAEAQRMTEPATLIFSALEVEAADWCNEALLSDTGGLAIDVTSSSSSELLSIATKSQHVNLGWSTISAADIAEETHRQRFYSFTGRRAPVFVPASAHQSA